jgi:hypothetical protein
MLPGLRILLAAVFMTAIVVNLVASVLMSGPGESLTDAVAFPRIEQPLVQQARTTNPKQLSRMPGYASATELTSSAPGTRTMDGGTSTYAKRLGPNTAESEARSSLGALAPVRPAENSSTQSVDPAVTGSVSSPSISTGNPSPPVGAAVASSAGVQNQVARKCGPCSWDDRQRGYRRIGFRGFGRRPHVSPDRNSFF